MTKDAKMSHKVIFFADALRSMGGGEVAGLLGILPRSPESAKQLFRRLCGGQIALPAASVVTSS